MLAESDADGFLVFAQQGGMWLLRPHPGIGGGRSLLPLGDGLRVDAVPPGQNPYARLTMLYRATDRLCRAGAAV